MEALEINRYQKSKEAEKAAYQALYSTGKEFASSEVREDFLFESENRFRQLLISASKGSRVLEIGCGSGFHSRLAAEAGGQVLAIDNVQAAINVARGLDDPISPRVRYELTDIDELSNSPEKFDLIIDHEVFSSINVRTALPLFAELLAPGGKLIGLECLGHNPIFNLNRRINVWRGKRTAWAVDHIVKLEDVEYAKKFFRSVRVEYYHFFIFLLYPFRVALGPRLSAPVEKFLRKLDQRLLGVPWLGRFCFKVVFVLAK